MSNKEIEMNGQIATATDEVVNIEAYAKSGQKPPKAERYQIRIDKIQYTVDVVEMSGRQLLQLAEKVPPENYMLTLKIHGGQPKPIGLDDIVSFLDPGVERFMTLPKDQTEGEQ